MSLKDVIQKRDINSAKKRNVPTETENKTEEPNDVKENDLQVVPATNEIVEGKNFLFRYDYLLCRRREKRYVKFNHFEKLNVLDSAKNARRFRFKEPAKAKPLLIEYKPNAQPFNIDDIKEFTPEQHKWRANTVTNEDLRTATPDVVKSKNSLGWRRYIFVNVFMSNINGMLYYSAPLILNVIWLIVSIVKFDFIGNLIAATCVLLDILGLKAIIKSDDKPFMKVFTVMLLLSLPLVALQVLYVNFNDIYKLLDFWYISKLVLIYFCIFYFARFYVLFALSYAQDVKADFGNVVKCKSGKPRVGKTSQGVHEATVLALLKWNQLQYDFWDWHSREAEILARNDVDELLEYHAIKESYSFYIVRTCIPCLWSNIGIELDGRMSHKVTLNHIRGAERLPLYSVIFFDEIGAVLKAEMGRRGGDDRMYDVSDMFRLGGHFLKWSVICCEQDFNNFYIDCRRVVGVNELILEQSWVGKPVFLLGLYNFLRFIVGDSLDVNVKRNKKFAAFMKKFKDFVFSIGFRRQIYCNIGNTQTGATSTFKDADGTVYDLGNKCVRYIPSNLIADYDDRAYKQDYFSYFDRTINGELHEKLHIKGYDFKTARQFVSETGFIRQKRKAQQDKLEKIA